MVDASLDDGQLKLDQEPFQLLTGAGAGLDDWKIPLTVSVDGTDDLVLMVPQGRIQLDDMSVGIVVDPHSHGFFRVRYDDELSQRLANNLMQLTAGQRYDIFDDLFDLVLAGHRTAGDFMTLAQSVSGETSPPVWSALASGFSTLHHVCLDDEQRAVVAQKWAQVAGPQLDALGFDQTDPNEEELINEVRASLYGSLGALSKRADVIEHARGVFDGSIETTNASIESAAVRVIASTGDRSDYDEMFRRFQEATSPQIERRYLFALARFQDESAIDDLCARSLDGSVRSQDAAFVLGMAMSNRRHGSRVWDFVTSRWDDITEAVPDNSLGRMLGGVKWLEHGNAAAVHGFVAEHPVPQARLAVAQHLEGLDVHVALKDRITAELG